MHTYPEFQRSPELSQHFFRDPRLVRRVFRALPIRTSTVVEIGSGNGIITDVLADSGFRVIAIEKDARLFRALRSRFIGRTNVEIHHADALELGPLREEHTLVANVPFGITAAVIRSAVRGPHPPTDAFLVLQLEAARKFAGTPAETLFSLLHKPSFDLSILRVFRRIDFEPAPRVRAALLHIHRRVEPLIETRSSRRYRRFVESTFGARPSIGRALRSHFTRTQIRRLASDLRFSTDARPSALTFPQWLAIFRFYEHACMGRDPTVLTPLLNARLSPTPCLQYVRGSATPR